MKTREQLEATGNKILNSVRTELYLSMRFMGPALGSLGFAMDLSTRTVGTDAVYIRFNPTYLLQTYIERPEILNRTYMHMLMHCLFRHMFSAKQHEEAQLWDLCCDIAVESVVDSMDYPTILRVTSDFRQEWYEKLEKEVQEANRNVHQLQTNLEAYRKIEFYEWYRPHQDIFKQENTEGGSQTTRSCTEMIEELIKLNKQFNDLQKELHQHINAFVGHFGEDNTFKFQTKLNENWEYTRFAEDLQDFIDENRISEFIKRINNEHSDVFKRISMDTSMLTTSEADIPDLINKVNKGFQTCNFVGVIQRIEMKVEESSNRVVNSLRAIQKYYNEHVYDLAPGTTLFSSENEQLVKQEAIALLRDFIKEIHAYRYDSIRLYDSFELRVRIVENNNDTGFVEKLSNVGSEGTDILVKAMINIMLLYVFKEGASHKFKDFKLHCMMDEIGKLHPNNVNGILKFANDRNIILINGSPTELNREAYKHVYLLTKGAQSKTRIARLISDQQL